MDASGVEGALVGDAGVANGIGEPAVSQQAPPTLMYSGRDRDGEANDRGRS